MNEATRLSKRVHVLLQSQADALATGNTQLAAALQRTIDEAETAQTAAIKNLTDEERHRLFVDLQKARRRKRTVRSA